MSFYPSRIPNWRVTPKTLLLQAIIDVIRDIDNERSAQLDIIHNLDSTFPDRSEAFDELDAIKRVRVLWLNYFHHVKTDRGFGPPSYEAEEIAKYGV